MILRATPLPPQRLGGTVRWGIRPVTAHRLRSRENLRRAGPEVPGGLLSQAGDRQCSLSELGEGSRGRPAATQRTCRRHRHARALGEGWSAGSMSSALRGPLGRIHPALPPFACPVPAPLTRHICLAQSWPAGLSLPHSSGGRSSAAPFYPPSHPPQFLSTEVKGEVAPNPSPLPVDTAFSSTRLWTKPGLTPPSGLC